MKNNDRLRQIEALSDLKGYVTNATTEIGYLKKKTEEALSCKDLQKRREIVGEIKGLLEEAKKHYADLNNLDMQKAYERLLTLGKSGMDTENYHMSFVLLSRFLKTADEKFQEAIEGKDDGRRKP